LKLSRSAAVSLFLFAIGAASVSRADLLYTVNGSSLFVVDTDQPAPEARRIGSLGPNRVGGIAFGTDGKLYGVSTITNKLLRIDPRTGAATPIGSKMAPTVTLSTDIACCDPASDALWGAADFDPNTVLFKIEPATGATAEQHQLTSGGIVGLAFDRTGQLWGIDGRFDTHEQLVQIDTKTGQVREVAPKGLADFADIGGLAIGPSGFWALNSNQSGVQLLSIDPVMGKVSSAKPINGLRGDLGVFGLVAGPVIPEPSALVIAMLGICGLHVLAGWRATNRWSCTRSLDTSE
jgi:hypothetical protein